MQDKHGQMHSVNKNVIAQSFRLRAPQTSLATVITERAGFPSVDLKL